MDHAAALLQGLGQFDQLPRVHRVVLGCGAKQHSGGLNKDTYSLFFTTLSREAITHLVVAAHTA